MKTTLYSLIAAATACGLASTVAQTTATTAPVGYETINLPAGVEYNLLGIRLQEPTVAAGTLSGITATTVSDQLINFDTLLTVGKTYILEITSGTLEGVIQEVVSWGTASGNTSSKLVTAADLLALGVQQNDSYSLRPAPVLEKFFSAANMKVGFTGTAADNIWVPNGVGGYVKYYVSQLAGNPIKNAATNINAPNVPLIYQDGLLIQKRATSPTSTVTASGAVKITGTITPLLAGSAGAPSFNVIATTFPAGSTLQNSGIKSSLKVGFTATASDNVWVPNGAGGYTKYFVSQLAGNPWKNSATNANVTEDVTLPSAVLIERKGVATNVKLTPPSSYAGL